MQMMTDFVSWFATTTANKFVAGNKINFEINIDDVENRTRKLSKLATVARESMFSYCRACVRYILLDHESRESFGFKIDKLIRF